MKERSMIRMAAVSRGALIALILIGLMIHAAPVALAGAWSALGAGIEDSGGNMTWDGAGNLYVCGPYPSISCWDGETWSVLSTWMDIGANALAHDGTYYLYACGDFWRDGCSNDAYVARWDGQTWVALWTGENCEAVEDLVLGDLGRLYLGGAFNLRSEGLAICANIACWDGSSWKAMGTGLFPNIVSVLAWDEFRGSIYAGGLFDFTGEEKWVPVKNIARWDGNNWNALGAGVNLQVGALACDGAGNLYVGGVFSTAGGVSANRIAKWDGSAWSALGSGMGGEPSFDWVYALAWDGSILYAGGEFTTAGGVSANRIAKWDGSSWSPLGSGLTSESESGYACVYDLAVDNEGNLYVSGIFDSAGGVSVNNIAKWDPSAAPSPTPPPVEAPRWIYDYNGDGTSDIAVFRGSSGMWSVRSLTRAYFGNSTDSLVPADYNGDGTTDIAIFRQSTGMWSVRSLSRFYLGISGDVPVPGDYVGNGTAVAGLFRGSAGLWAIRNVTRAYFGSTGDSVVPGYYNSDSIKDIAIFRGSTGMWSVRGISRFYFGAATDDLVPGDYNGMGKWEGGIFRPSTGMWSIRNVTRFYLGNSTDQAVPADYNGNGVDDAGIFRDSSGMWAVRNLTRVYFGSTDDIPVTR